MTGDDLATLQALPDGALLPVAWVRKLVANLEGDVSGGIGMTVKELAEASGRAPSTVRTWCAEGRLPGALRLCGREWRIPATAVASLLAGTEPDRPSPVARLDVPTGGLAAWRDAQ